MSTPDSHQKLKEEAKAIRARLDALIRSDDLKARIVRTVCIYAGLITETLVEYEEPDVVMEQAFHRIADLLRAEPAGGEDDSDLMPLAYTLDHDTELGRHLARNVAEKLPKGMDDVHEIAIALIIDDFPVWEKQGYPRAELLRLLIESVIASLTYEMAAQDFCDLLIEEFIADGEEPGAALLAVSAAAGHYLAIAESLAALPEEAEREMTNVMVRESLRHGTPGPRNWGVLAAANDMEDKGVPDLIRRLKPEVDEFFGLIGLENPLGRAVAVAKAAGRMIAVITVEDVGQIHPSIAKSLAKTGMILGSRYREDTKT